MFWRDPLLEKRWIFHLGVDIYLSRVWFMATGNVRQRLAPPRWDVSIKTQSELGINCSISMISPVTSKTLSRNLIYLFDSLWQRGIYGISYRTHWLHLCKDMRGIQQTNLNKFRTFNSLQPELLGPFGIRRMVIPRTHRIHATGTSIYMWLILMVKNFQDIPAFWILWGIYAKGYV